MCLKIKHILTSMLVQVSDFDVLDQLRGSEAGNKTPCWQRQTTPIKACRTGAALLGSMGAKACGTGRE